MLKPGKPGPLGAHITPEGINFALFRHMRRELSCAFLIKAGIRNLMNSRPQR